MKETIVGFKVAKLAKEKGFWIASYKCYDEIGFLNDTCNDEAVSFKYDYKTLPSKDNYLAPTQSLLQKWLREVHNIHIEILYHRDANCFILKVCSNMNHCIFKGDTFYDSYEEALEEGLFKALKLINNED